MLMLLIMYALLSLMFKWIISWGGAEKLEGWKAFFIISWLSGSWTVEQIKLYALICWVIQTIGLMLKIVWM